MATISDPAHIKDNELVVNLRQNKYGLVMSKYSFELLLCFLQDNKFMLILRLMNQYITIEGWFLVYHRYLIFIHRLATSDKPGSQTVGEDSMGLTGVDSSLRSFNQQPIKLGRMEKDRLFYEDIERALATQVCIEFI